MAHAAGQDLDVLLAACGALPAHVFDTQIVAGFLGMSSPSLARLVDQILGVTLPKADRLSDWIVRPIPDRQLSYAANDVVHLLELHRVLTEKLESSGRLSWALDECAQTLGARRPRRVPEEAWWKMGDVRNLTNRSRGVAQDVAAWRERKAEAANRPRRSVLSDLALLAIAQRPPRNREELQQIRGLDGRHLAQGGGAEILEAIRRGSHPGSRRICGLPPEGNEIQAPPAAVAVCSGLVRQIADNLRFDQGLLATRADIAQLLCGEPSRLDVGWRRAIAGDPTTQPRWRARWPPCFDADGTMVLEERSGRSSPLPGVPRTTPDQIRKNTLRTPTSGHTLDGGARVRSHDPSDRPHLPERL